MNSAATENRRFAWQLAAIFLLLVLALGAGGSLYLSRQRADTRAAAQQSLSAIADLKLDQITNWREERLSDARFFFRARFVAQDVKRLLEAPDSQAARADVRHWLNLLKGGDRYAAAALFDPKLERRLAIPDSAGEPTVLLRALFERALQTRDVVMSDLHQDEASRFIHLDLLLPIFEHADPASGPPIAVVLLKLDARRFLFPVVQTWPSPSQTAETLLVRQEGRDVLFLNDLRHRPGSALNLRLPLANTELPAARVLRGETQPIEGRDYRGTPVVAVGRQVPGTSWAMVAKMDAEELYAPIRHQMRMAALMLGVLLLACTLLVALIWRQRCAQFLQRELALERERAIQSAAHEREIVRLNRLYAALSHVNQAVVHAIAREDLLQEVCRVLVQHGGFQMACVVWNDEHRREFVPVAAFGEDGGYLSQIQVFAGESPEERCPVGTAVQEKRACVCHDFCDVAKSRPWREVALRSGWRSMAAFPIAEGGDTRGALAVFSRQNDCFSAKEEELLAEVAGDVAFGLDSLRKEQQRQEAEEALRQSEARFRAIFDHAGLGIGEVDEQCVFQVVNERWCQIVGRTRKQFLGMSIHDLTHPEDRTASGRLNAELWAGRIPRLSYDKRYLSGDGGCVWVRVTGTLIRDPAGKPLRNIVMVEDITERKRVEEQLHLQAAALQSAANAIVITDRQGTIQWVNAAFERLTGFTAAEAIGDNPRVLKSGRQDSAFFHRMWEGHPGRAGLARRTGQPAQGRQPVP